MIKNTLLLFCFFSSIYIQAQTYCALVVLNDKRAAYIDTTGKILYTELLDVVSNDHLCAFKNGFARLRRYEKFTFINEKGVPLFSTAFEKAEDFSEGLAEVRVNSKWGFIDTKGELVIKPTFYETGVFSCGLSSFASSPKGKHGFINNLGDIVVKPQFDRVKKFKNNRAWVLIDGKWGCINTMGNYIINPIYYDCKDFNEGYAWVKKDQLWGLIDSLGNYLIKPDERNPLIYAQNATFKNFESFNNGLMLIKNNNKVGFCDKTLKKIIPTQYEQVLQFKNGEACVKINGYWGIIDTIGNYIITPKYNAIKLGTIHLYPAENKEGLWGYINEQEEWVIKPQFNNAYQFEYIQK